MKITFVGRQQELKRMDDLWDWNRAQLMFLYGRRRVGKTALLVEWIRRSGNRVFYWAALPTSAVSQLRDFSQALYSFSHPGSELPEDFTYASWKQAFEEIARLAQNQKFALFIDDFEAIMAVYPSLAGELQHIWDHRLSKTNLFFCICTSHLGMVWRELVSYQAPLYGRASAQFYLRPFFFGQIRLFFPEFSAADRVTLYSIFGGVPAYWKRLDLSQPILQTIQNELLTPGHPMQVEPFLLLQDYVSEPQNHISILSAIANGAHTIKAISQATGLTNVDTPEYLGVLTEAGFVERRAPVTEVGPARQGHYHIADPYLRFYFRFLANQQAQFVQGEQEQVLAEITRCMGNFISRYAWKEICREWVLRAGAAGILPDWPEKVGSIWNSRTHVDIAGINFLEKTIILGECVWTVQPGDRKMMVKLVQEKAYRVIPARGNWKVYFLGFSKSGWNDSALAYKDEINKKPVSGKNWVSTGMQLIDLERLDADMLELTTRVVKNGDIEF